MSARASVVFLFTSSTTAKRYPLRYLYIRGNKKKSRGAISGESGGWGKTAIPFLAMKVVTEMAAWAGA
jgi:hypothetical protein